MVPMKISSISAGASPASRMASVATFTIRDSMSSLSCLPNRVWDHPTMQAVIGTSERFGLDIVCFSSMQKHPLDPDRYAGDEGWCGGSPPAENKGVEPCPREP